MPTESSLDDKIKAIRQLLELFRFERIVYLIITLISLIILIGCALYLLLQGTSQVPAVVGLFTSSGAVAYTCGRLLKMWGDAIQLLGSMKNEE